MTEVQSNASVGRPLPVPSREELPPLLARTPLAIIDEALTFLRIHPAMFFGLAAIVVLPLQLLILLLPGSSLRGNRPDRTVDILISSIDQPSAVANGFGALVFESIALFTVAAIYGEITAAWYARTSISMPDLLKSSLKRSPVIIAVWVVTHVAIVFGGIISLGLLAVIIGSFFIVAAPAMGAEGLGVADTLRRSRQLANAKFIHCLIVFVAVAGAGQVMDLSLRFAPTFLLNQLDVPVWITGGVFDVVASVVVVAFTAATSVVLYLDLRVRREGIDLYMALDRSFDSSKAISKALRFRG